MHNFLSRLAGILLMSAIWCGPLPSTRVICAGEPPSALSPEMYQAVTNDWANQESRWNRQIGSAEALEAALVRADKILSHLEGEGVLSKASAAAAVAELNDLRSRAARCASHELYSVYLATRLFTRHLVLSDPAISGQPIVFMTRNRFVCQMLHEYMGYFYDYGDVPGGGGVHILQQPGVSMTSRELIQSRLPRGNYTTLALSHDASSLYFAFAERSEKKPAFNSPDRKSFQLYRLSLKDGALQQLTSGVEDYFDPCPLPDGGLAFMSTRRGGFARCNNGWEPCASYTLHRMDGDGSNMRTLSVHETSEWHPSVLNDGRLVYIRWDYVDRSAANFHGLWACNPDGSGVSAVFGNYTMKINACYQPRAIPGSSELIFIAGAHHADVGGSLVKLDPARARYDPNTGEDHFDSITPLTPEVCFPESTGWPVSYFHGPWPISDTRMLVAFSFEKLPGMSSGESRDTHTGLYYFDTFGNLELVYRAEGISAMYPIPLRARARPPVIASALEPQLASTQEGELLLADVQRSHFPMPPGRPVKELRVFQLLPKGGNHVANQPRIGHANAENARMLLGSVPVEADGSAWFRVPAGKPLYLQAVDGDGRAVQSMRSALYLQPGERRSCVGCHETPGTAAANQPLIALRRGPSRLRPGPVGSHPMNYTLLVQPVLDRNCASCHDGSDGDGRSRLVLTGAPDREFSKSYAALKPWLRWYEWGDASISQIATRPGQIGADASPLTSVLKDENHRAAIRWNDSDLRTLYLWLDANVPFYGTYDPSEQVAQRAGNDIPPPKFQ